MDEYKEESSIRFEMLFKQSVMNMTLFTELILDSMANYIV